MKQQQSAGNRAHQRDKKNSKPRGLDKESATQRYKSDTTKEIIVVGRQWAEGRRIKSERLQNDR